MRGNAHVRFGGRAGETERPKGRHRASVRPYYEKVRDGGRIVHTAVLVAIAANERRAWPASGTPITRDIVPLGPTRV